MHQQYIQGQIQPVRLWGRFQLYLLVKPYTIAKVVFGIVQNYGE